MKTKNNSILVTVRKFIILIIILIIVESPMYGQSLDSIYIENHFYPAPTISNLITMDEMSLSKWKEEMEEMFNFSDNGFNNGGQFVGSGSDLTHGVYVVTKYPGEEVSIEWDAPDGDELSISSFDKLEDKLNPYFKSKIDNPPANLYIFEFNDETYKIILDQSESVEFVILKKMSSQ